VDPSEVHTRWLAAMRAGDFEAAWRQTDRLELPRRERERAGDFVWGSQHLLWNGTPFTDRRVLIRCNHGLGDTLQFVRFVPDVQATARSVTLWTQPALVSLLRLMPEFGEVRDGWTDRPPPEHDVEVEVMELAYALRRTAGDVSSTRRYLSREGIRAHSSFLRPRDLPGGPRVGLLWAASAWDASRSIPLRELEPLAQARDCRFYSLQQGRESLETRTAPFAIEPWSARTTEILDAAAAMLELDLIITVDSMAAHLAGALGRPVWLLLQHSADWRWGSAPERTPWYPTMRLFRQPAPGAWSAVIEKVASALDEW
jgi:hypothetical protein